MSMPSPTAIASASSSPVAAGSFSDLLNTDCANGYLKIKMVAPAGSTATLTGGGIINATELIKITLDANGIPSAGQSMFISSQFSSPVNPGFNIEIHNSNDRIVGTIQGAVISGVAPVDLTTLTGTNNGASYIAALLLGTGTTTSAQLATALTDETGTGAAVFATSPTLVTPNIGAATATTVNKVTITQPATSATLTIQDGTTVKGPSSVPTGALIAFGVPSKQIFTGNGTFTIPTGVTAVKVTLVAAGGGGGGSTSTNNGGGGGSGGAAIKWLSGLTPANTIAVTVGTAGTAGTTGSSGGNGGNSTIASGTQTITTVTANGGNGGAGNGTQSTGGGGGAISTNGDANFGGISGFDGIGISGGPGGGSIFGGGAPSSNGGLAGNAALSAGGGGGGAGAGGNRSGGAGGAGIVIFEWVT